MYVAGTKTTSSNLSALVGSPVSLALGSAEIHLGYSDGGDVREHRLDLADCTNLDLREHSLGCGDAVSA